MTPSLRLSLRAMGITGKEFARIVGRKPDQVSSWGHATPEPEWAWVVTRAWQACPAALAAEREGHRAESVG